MANLADASKWGWRRYVDRSPEIKKRNMDKINGKDIAKYFGVNTGISMVKGLEQWHETLSSGDRHRLRSDIMQNLFLHYESDNINDFRRLQS